jgi:hypothetical protein
LFLDGLFIAHGEELSYFDQTNDRARILSPGESRVVLNSLVPARFLNQKEIT